MNERINSLVSVIIPVYNGEKYIEQCLHSVLNQDYKYLEILIIDDGSTDSTNDICKKFQNQDNRIKLITKSNNGVSSARNTGLSLSNGDYIAFVDADDIIKPNFISTLLFNLIDNDAEISVCGLFSFDEIKEFTPCDKLNDIKVFNKEELLLSMFDNYDVAGYSWNKMFNKTIIDDIKFDETIKILEDHVFCQQYINKIEKGVIISDKLYGYRLNYSSASKSKFNLNQITSLKGLDCIIEMSSNYSFLSLQTKKNINNMIITSSSYIFKLLFGRYKEKNKNLKYILFYFNKYKKEVKLHTIKGFKNKIKYHISSIINNIYKLFFAIE